MQTESWPPLFVDYAPSLQPVASDVVLAIFIAVVRNANELPDTLLPSCTIPALRFSYLSTNK